MALAVFKRQHGDFVLFVVVVRQTHGTVENFQDARGFVFHGSRVRAVAFEAESVALGAQEFRAFATVGLVASAAALREGRLVVHGLFGKLGDVRMAAETDFDGICFRQTNVLAGVRIVAIGAIAGGAGMLHLGAFDLLGLFVVAGHAKRFRVRLGQHNFSVFCRRVADFALLVVKRRMRVLGKKLGSI